MEGNKEEEIKGIIKTYREVGKSNNEIRTGLLKRGYSSDAIDNALKGINLPKLRLPKLPGKTIGYILLAVIAVIALYFLISLLIPVIGNLSAASCTDTECFLSAANECKSVRMQQNEAGSLFEYSARDCALTKTAKKLNESEPVEMRDLLEGKSMTCIYEQGALNENWISTLSIDIDSCEGELKDAIEELVSAI